jgi:hypothetical protein
MMTSVENTESEYARIADTQYLVRRSMTKGYQLFSILTPPIYIGFSLYRKGRGHFTVNRLLRATWLSGVAGMYHRTTPYPIYAHVCNSGIASGGTFEYVRSSNSSLETLRSRRIHAAIDVAILAPFNPLVTISHFLFYRGLLIGLTTMPPLDLFSSPCLPPLSFGNTERLLIVGFCLDFVD